MRRICLRGWLASAEVGKLADLVQEITGADLIQPPMTAPTLLFTDPQVKTHLDLPYNRPGEVLLHDYQALDAAGPMPMDQALDVYLDLSLTGPNTEFTCLPAPGITMRVALRLVQEADVAAARPLADRGGKADDLETGTLSVSAQQVARYLDLSGDDNPLHRDAAQARALGLAGPVVPGLLLMALCQPLIEQALGANTAVTSLRARFLAPLCAAAPFCLRLTRRGAARARLSVLTKDGAVAVIDAALG